MTRAIGMASAGFIPQRRRLSKVAFIGIDLTLDDFSYAYGPGSNNSLSTPGAMGPASSGQGGGSGSDFWSSVGAGVRVGAAVGGATGIGSIPGALGGGVIGGLASLFDGTWGGNRTMVGRSGSQTSDSESQSASGTYGDTLSDSGPTVSDTSNPERPLTQSPTLIPQSQQPSTPAPVPETSVLPDSSVPTPSQAAQEQEAEFERVEQQAKEDERRRRAALRAYLNPTGPSGLRARPLVVRPRLLGD